MTTAEAIRQLRNDPAHSDLVRDAYLGPDTADAAERFFRSAEFSEVIRLIPVPISGAVVLDVGAGSGIASYAFAMSGAKRVIALEPDESEIGRGAIGALQTPIQLEVLAGVGEDIPLGDDSADVVYARQVLHHTSDLAQVLSECHRVLRPGGVFVACREHVVDDSAQLSAFLRAHPVHRLAGGEHAFPLEAYLHAIESSGLELIHTLGHWDSVINAFPAVRSAEELDRPGGILRKQFGLPGKIVGSLPVLDRIAWKRMKDVRFPGRLYSFIARKP